MVVSYHTNKLRKVCNEEKAGIKAMGAECARKLRQRLAELAAAEALADISHLPPSRCHELTNRGGVFSVDLQHPYRLLLIPANEPVPRKPDGGLDLNQITAVEITGIEDTHDAKNQRRG
jgi:proteic killer suppression protein